MYGLDHLGLAKYSQIARGAFPDGFALGAFSHTFGNSTPPVAKILGTKRCNTVRIHLDWRDDHNYGPEDYPRIVKQAKRWAPLVKATPNVKWYFSGACENHLSAKQASILASKVLEVLPTVIYVQCGTTRITGDNIINEVHGNKALPLKGRYIFSFDGNACVDSNVQRIKDLHKDAEIFFFWEPRFNGRWESTDNTMRPLRQGWPDTRLIKSVVALAGDKGKTQLSKQWIYKSHAEMHGKNDKRGEHPVMIAPIKVDQIVIKSMEGEPLGTLNYFGPYITGGHRYYGKRMGFEIAQEPVRVWAGGVSYGVINPAFRDGTYHD